MDRRVALGVLWALFAAGLGRRRLRCRRAGRATRSPHRRRPRAASAVRRAPPTAAPPSRRHRPSTAVAGHPAGTSTTAVRGVQHPRRLRLRLLPRRAGGGERLAGRRLVDRRRRRRPAGRGPGALRATRTATAGRGHGDLVRAGRPAVLRRGPATAAVDDGGSGGQDRLVRRAGGEPLVPLARSAAGADPAAVIASSSRSAATQTRQAPSTCAADQGDRQVGGVLHVADEALRQHDGQQHRPAPAQLGRRVGARAARRRARGSARPAGTPGRRAAG